MTINFKISTQINHLLLLFVLLKFYPYNLHSKPFDNAKNTKAEKAVGRAAEHSYQADLLPVFTGVHMYL